MGTAARCDAWFASILAFSYATEALASLVIALRIIAVWKRNIVISLAASCLWLAPIALSLRTFILAAEDGICSYAQAHHEIVPDVGVLILASAASLVLMLVGLPWRTQTGFMGIYRLLHQQGIGWAAVSMLAGIPRAVLVALGSKQISPAVEAAIFGISATRMYRQVLECSTDLTIFDTVDRREVTSIIRFRPDTRTQASSFAVAGAEDIPLQMARGSPSNESDATTVQSTDKGIHQLDRSDNQAYTKVDGQPHLNVTTRYSSP